MPRVISTSISSDCGFPAIATQHMPPLLLLDVPVELLSHVLSKMTDAQSLLNAAASCKALGALEEQSRDHLWRSLTMAKWPSSGSYALLAKLSWKARYKFYYQRVNGLATQGEALTRDQLNERFEFFVELGSFPHHGRGILSVVTQEQPNVTLRVEMGQRGGLRCRCCPAG